MFKSEVKYTAGLRETEVIRLTGSRQSSHNLPNLFYSYIENGMDDDTRNVGYSVLARFKKKKEKNIFFCVTSKFASLTSLSFF